MRVLDILDVDCANYKKTAMFLITPKCTFKCNKDANCEVCQNQSLMASPAIDFPNDKLILRYHANELTHAVVIGGLEPFDTFEDVMSFIDDFRSDNEDDIVIYTGYKEEEVADKMALLRSRGYDNIIIKFGRFIPDETSHFDKLLGVNLASSNQYAVAV